MYAEFGGEVDEMGLNLGKKKRRLRVCWMFFCCPRLCVGWKLHYVWENKKNAFHVPEGEEGDFIGGRSKVTGLDSTESTAVTVISCLTK